MTNDGWSFGVECVQNVCVVQKRIIASLLAFSALLVCILPPSRLCCHCGNLRNDSSHVVGHSDQSASFRIFDSAFYFPHSAIPHFTHSLLNYAGDTCNAGDLVICLLLIQLITGGRVQFRGPHERKWRRNILFSLGQAPPQIPPLQFSYVFVQEN